MAKVSRNISVKNTEDIADDNGSKKKLPIINRVTIFASVVVLLFITSIGATVYFYLQTVKLKNNPKITAVEQQKEIIDKVSRLMMLPSDEEPTIAQVSDPNALKDQEFFSKSQKGDQILIYQKSKQAILYRPSTDKIVGVSPISVGDGATGDDKNTAANTNAPVPKKP